MRQYVIRHFNRIYYESRRPTWTATQWLGVDVAKNPCDLWTYQELIWRIRPTLVVETGTLFGGSALFFATVLDLIGDGRVVTIDIESRDRPEHPRIEYATGSSTDAAIIEQVRSAAGDGPVLVVLDADHSRDHVLGEMRAFADLVTPGSYMVVEDTNINGHPVAAGFGPGPWEAVELFLAEDDRFVVDLNCERHLLTFNPCGWLHRQF